METIKKYRIYIIAGIIIILFLAFRSCSENKQSELRGKNKTLQEQVNTLKDGVKLAEESRLKERDSINTEFNKKAERIRQLEDKDKINKDRIAELQNKNKANKDRIAKLNFKELAKEFNDIYQTGDARAVDLGVILENDLPNLVLQTISDANECQDVVAIKDEQLADKDSVIKEKDAQIKDKSVLLISAEKQIERQKELENLQTDLNKSLNKENKSLRKSKWFNKYVVIPLAFIGGGVLGHQIAK